MSDSEVVYDLTPALVLRAFARGKDPSGGRKQDHIDTARLDE